ncbi:MAG: RNA polymerase sigma factor [Chitinophagaceae bacterium]|nr:RNA polymerase sigma factor [Chitinophagaceae bacterium]
MLTEKSQKSIIQKAIDSLPEKQRLAFVLAKYEELPQRQVAEILEVSEGAVEQLILRAKNNLKKIRNRAGGAIRFLLNELSNS